MRILQAMNLWDLSQSRLYSKVGFWLPCAVVLFSILLGLIALACQTQSDPVSQPNAISSENSAATIPDKGTPNTTVLPKRLLDTSTDDVPLASYEAPGSVVSGPSPDLPQAFDGTRAFEWILKQVWSPDGTLRTRFPGSFGAQETRSMLLEELKAMGWDVQIQEFTGADFLSLDLDPVSSYIQSCGPEAIQEVNDLSFVNLVASYGEGETIALGAHYDTKRTSSKDPNPDLRDSPVPGANDGASGVAVLVELARLIPQAMKDRRVILLFFDGEDGFEDCHPLAGSLYYTQNLTATEREDIRSFILLDMVGDSHARFPKEGISIANAPRWVSLIWDIAAEQGTDYFVQELGASVLDDHISFYHVGIPAISVIDLRPGFPTYWHTTADLPENLSHYTLAAVGDVLMELLNSHWPPPE